MPDSKFGHSPGTLEATLSELVALARHLRETPASIPSRLGRLEGLAQMLAYFVAPRVVGLSANADSDSWPIAITTHCAHTDCSHTWRDHDACLLNFAERGTPPLWLCRDHHPPLTDGGIRPPGWTHDNPTRDSVELARKTALGKLGRDELRSVNPRVGG